MLGDFGAQQTGALFYRKEGKKVYLLVPANCHFPIPFDTGEHLLYDFAAQVNDTFFYKMHQGVFGAKVLAIDSAINNNSIRKQWEIVPYPNTNLWFHGIYWFEGVGSETGPFIPVYNNWHDGHTLHCLRTNSDSTIFGESPFCNTRFYGVGVNESGKSKINVYPNPCNNIVFVEGIENPSLLRVYDLKGNVIPIKTSSDYSGMHFIETTNLANGTYYLLAQNPNGYLCTRFTVLH